jgi:SAM-dependent methyltransferase
MTLPWWQDFFHGVSLDFWRAVISDSQTGNEASFIHRQLQLPIGAAILDVPCGNGRLSLVLARQGFQMSAVDIAPEFIEEASAKSMEDGLDIDWHQREMRDLPWESEFDGAFCFGNSFGYLDDEENSEFLKAISRTLKTGARFVLDAPAIAECVLPHLQPHRTMEIAGINVEIDTRYDEGQRRMFNDFTFTRNGKTEKRPSSQRIYTYQELLNRLVDSGFEFSAAFSSTDDAPFETGSQRLLLVATRSP